LLHYEATRPNQYNREEYKRSGCGPDVGVKLSCRWNLGSFLQAFGARQESGDGRARLNRFYANRDQ